MIGKVDCGSKCSTHPSYKFIRCSLYVQIIDDLFSGECFFGFSLAKHGYANSQKEELCCSGLYFAICFWIIRWPQYFVSHSFHLGYRITVMTQLSPIAYLPHNIYDTLNRCIVRTLWLFLDLVLVMTHSVFNLISHQVMYEKHKKKVKTCKFTSCDVNE